MTVDDTTMHRSPSVVIEPRAVDVGLSPWAPGGSMDDIAPAPDRSAPSTPPRRPGRRPRRRGAVAMVATAVVAGLGVGVAVAVLGTGGSERDGRDDPTEPAESTPPSDAARDSVGPAETVAPRLEALPPFIPLTPTAIGDIEWTRITGDDGSIPELVTPGPAGELIGTDRTGRGFESTDGGRTWRATGPTDAVRTIGATSWRADDGGGIAHVVGADDATPPPFEPDLLAGPSGWRVWIEAQPASGGFPIAAGDEAFVPATRRARLPWAQIGGGSEGSPHRVRVAIGERVVMSVDGDFHEMPITQYRVRPPGAPEGDPPEAERWEVVDAGGAVVWTFDATTEHDAVRAVTGTSEAVWLRWDGRHLAAASAPWPADHDVTVVELPDAILARSAEPSLLELALWRSEGGVDWEPVELPTAPQGDNPAHLVSSGDGAVLTLLATEGWTNWSTSDGRTFDRVPNVTGIAERSQGSFGWVAADPRGLPLVRVSADGTSWEIVHLTPVLDPRAASWDTSMTATAVGSTIYVAVSTGATRTLLIGTVAG